MALREFEPIPANYYAKEQDGIGHSQTAKPFHCRAYSPETASRISIVRGMISTSTRAVIYTSEMDIVFTRGGLVEYLGKKLKIADLTTDTTDDNMLGADRYVNIERRLPHWMTLE
jgi:hypothetical protein